MTDPDFRNAFYTHKDVLYRFVYRMTGSANGAEDIVQECFLALWRKPEAYDRIAEPCGRFCSGLPASWFSNGGETSIRTTRSKRIRPSVGRPTCSVRSAPR